LVTEGKTEGKGTKPEGGQKCKVPQRREPSIKNTRNQKKFKIFLKLDGKNPKRKKPREGK